MSDDLTTAELCKRLLDLADWFRDVSKVKEPPGPYDYDGPSTFESALRAAAAMIEAQAGEIAETLLLLKATALTLNKRTAELADAVALLREAHDELAAETGSYDIHRDETECVFCHVVRHLGRDSPPMAHTPACIIARIDTFLQERPHG